MIFLYIICSFLPLADLSSSMDNLVMVLLRSFYDGLCSLFECSVIMILIHQCDWISNCLSLNQNILDKHTVSHSNLRNIQSNILNLNQVQIHVNRFASWLVTPLLFCKMVLIIYITYSMSTGADWRTLIRLLLYIWLICLLCDTPTKLQSQVYWYGVVSNCHIPR